MIKQMIRFSALSLLAAALATLPAQAQTQSTTSTNKPATDTTATSKKKAKKETTESKDTAAKKKSAHPFKGKLASMDKAAKTITIGKSTYQMTSDTIITKAGKPATLEDGVIGEEASGYAKPGEDGKMIMTKLRFGPKSDEKPAEKKK
jgi:uncharacterized membrane protein